jgi:DNA end-binding protein Ku
MTRAIWSGNLQFALINVPVKLHKANKDADVHFKNMHAVCHNPINLKKWCGICNKEVQADELNKGFALAKDKLIEFSGKELEAVAVQESKQIKIERVVEAAEILPIAYDSFYYLQPDKHAEHAYSLLAKALSVKNQVLVGRLIMRNKEHLCAVQHYDGGMMLITLHWYDELHSIKPLLEKIVQIPDEELQLAAMLLDRFRAPFGHETFKDTYRDKVTALIEKKMRGETITVTEVEVEPQPQKDLMAELRRSLEMPGSMQEAPVIKA